MMERRSSGDPIEGLDTHTIPFEGCRPVPLGRYLKALGVLRLVSEQADDEARGWWDGETFLLSTSLDREELRTFFLERYTATPILAPWNGGSGFYPGDNTKAIDAIARADAPRFRDLKRGIEQMRGLLSSEGLEARPDKDRKGPLLSRIRSEADETLLPWIDAVVVLTGDGPQYPPLLGTGGNDGRLDFTNNFMGRLVDLFEVDSGVPFDVARGLLDEALFAAAVPALQNSAMGQFAPGSAGGPNASTDFTGDALVNPWDFVLMLEGAVLFATAASRRLDSPAGGHLAFPFTVRNTGSGSGATALADETPARAETWVPLWRRPATLTEIRSLLNEGRVVVGRRRARDGLDFARAVAKLGVDRGITGFHRYAFLMRSGRAYLATPLNRVPVRRNPSADLIDQLEYGQWLGRFRRYARGEERPARPKSLVRRLEDALFELARGGGSSAPSVQRVLSILGEIQRYLASSPTAMDACRPVPLLGSEWARAANDGSAEFRLAAALAGIHGRRRATGRRALPMAGHIAPLADTLGRVREWDPDAHRTAVWGEGSLRDNLGRVMLRRLLEAESIDLDDLPLHATSTAPLSVTASWLAGAVDEERISELLLGLGLTRVPGGLKGGMEGGWPPTAPYALLKPLFTTEVQLRRTGFLADGVTLPPPLEMVRLLLAGRTGRALTAAHRILRSRGLITPHLTGGADLDGRRILSVLMVPISDYDLERLLGRVFDLGADQDHANPRTVQED